MRSLLLRVEGWWRNNDPAERPGKPSRITAIVRILAGSSPISCILSILCLYWNLVDQASACDATDEDDNMYIYSYIQPQVRSR